MRRFRLTSELAVAIGVLGLALFFAIGTLAITVTPSYSRIGPKVIPSIVAGAFAILGLVLMFQAITGRWRAPPESRPGNRSSFLWVAAGLILDAALMDPTGFIVASMVLFVCVARAFGSTTVLRDAAIGAALATVAFFGFTHLLELNLPVGRLWGLT